jgi:integrase
MPFLVERIPKYCKHKASGQAVVTIGGKDHYLGPWNSKASRAEYDRIIGEWIANGRRPLGVGKTVTDLSVGELIDRFITFADGYYRRPDGTATSEVSCFKLSLRVLNHLYGSKLVSEFGPLALEAVRNAMITKGWARGSINDQVGRMKRMFKWGVAKELVPPSVIHGLCAVAGLRAGRSEAKESEPVRPVSDEVVNATLPHLSSVVGAMVRLQRRTGARPGEICAMRTGDIDMSGQVWTYIPVTHKTSHFGHHRLIPIGPLAQEVLRPFLKPLNPTAFIFSPKDAAAESREARHDARKTPPELGNVIGSNRKRKPRRQPGEMYDVAAYRRAIARACDLAFPPPAELLAAGQEKALAKWRSEHRWHPHQLRHTAATEIRKRFGIEAAQTILGHATLSVTEIYAEKNAEAGRQVAALVG